MKLELVGELPNNNPYEVACELAQDVDLSRGTLRPRLDDAQVATGDIKRVQTADGGLVRYSTTTGYCFSWGQDVYWLNSNGFWQRVDSAGNTVSLTQGSAPTIGQIVSEYKWFESWAGNGTWNVTPDNAYPPTWNTVPSGDVTRTFSFSTAQDWSGVRYLVFYTSIPQDADATVRVLVNGNPVNTTVSRQPNGLYVIGDVSDVDMSSLSSYGISYTAGSNHTLRLGTLWGFYGVPLDRQVYVATYEYNGVESILSATASIKPYVPYSFVSSSGVKVRVNLVTPGSTVRLYRAIDGVYHEVASGTASTNYIYLVDKGDVGEPYRPSGILPFGPALVVGNRVVVASDRTVYLSQPGSPIRFGSIAINDDNLDAFSVVLPENVVALSIHELGVVAHTRNHQYIIRLQPRFDGDLLHRVPPMKLEAPTARSHRAVWGQLLVDAEGNAWLGNQRLFGGLSGDVHCVEVDGRLYLGAGNKIYVSKPSWKGWVEFTTTDLVQWMDTDGQDVYVATGSGLYKLEGSTTRKASCVWRTGKLFGDRISAVRYVHVAGTASTLKLTRPGLSDVVMTNASGRVHVPASQQTHEWQLEFSVASEIYVIHLSSEGGIK